MTRPRGELTTYRARGGHTTDWANPTRWLFVSVFDFHSPSASVKLPPEKFISSSSNTPGPQEVPNEAHKKFILNSGEDLYAELRDRNFNAVGPLLSKKAKMISAQFDVSWKS